MTAAPTLRVRAYHEAGHVIANWWFGIDVERAAIFDDDPYGLVEPGTTPPDFAQTIAVRPEWQIMRETAAWCAEAIALGEDPLKPSRPDHTPEKLVWTDPFLTDDERRVAWERTADLIRRSWKAVEAVAEALIVHRDLDAAALATIKAKDGAGLKL